MEITIIQIFALLFAGFAISRALLRFKDRKITGKELSFWMIIWAAVIVIALLPALTFYFSRLVGIGRGIDFVVYMSIILLFYLVFRIYVQLDSMERDISKIVQQAAIKRKK